MSNKKRQARLGLEVLEIREVLSWGSIPPASVPEPASPVNVTLDAQNKASGSASIAANEEDYFKFTAPVAGTYKLTATTPSSTLDTVLAAYKFQVPFVNLQRVGYNDDVTPDERDSATAVTLAKDQVIWVGITNYKGTAGGAYSWGIEGPKPAGSGSLNIDVDHFIELYKAQFGTPKASAETGLRNLLGYIKNDAAITDVRWAAYVLATAKHEVANTWLPIEEYGKGKNYAYGKADPITGQTYYGRGYVQLTHKYNYEKMSTVTGKDLVNNPSLALDPETAYKIMSHGMRNGTFTGKKLSNYFNNTTTDYVNARRIINGTDKAALIAGYGEKFEAMLKASTSNTSGGNGSGNDLPPANDFVVPRGQLTFDAEGQEGGPYHSRKLHWPGGASGVTIGRGYDMKEKAATKIKADLIAAGVSESLATTLSAGAGLSGTAANNFAKANPTLEITSAQQKKLFLISYDELAADVKRICEKSDVVALYGATNWNNLNATIKDVLVDLRFRGDYTSTSRQKLQKFVAENNLPEFAKVIQDRANWANVPTDRFNRRSDFVKAALSGGGGGNNSGNTTTLSGSSWVSKFPTSRSTADLEATFGAKVDRFIKALKDAGATVNIAATLRPPERAYLMHYSYKIANGQIDARNVPAKSGVNINWVHTTADGQYDATATKKAAADMVRGYGIVYAPALLSRHSQGLAIDMTITWTTTTLKVKDASGTEVTVSGAKNGADNTQLHAVGATYGVIKLVKDAPHWSSDGK